MTISSDHESGFTLAEMLVSLAILALIMGFMTGGLRFGTKVWGKSQSEMAALEEVMAVQDVLRQSLAFAYPETIAPEVRTVDFDGTSSEIRFITLLPEPLGGNLYVPATLEIEQLRGERQLRLTWCLDFDKDIDPENCTSKVLLSGFESADLTYNDPETGTRVSSWKHKRELPALITLDLAFKTGDRRQWPDLSVRPMIDRPASCRFDPISKDCRGA